MIVNDRFQFVFVHIPKCGGTSVRRALEDFDDRKAIYYDKGRTSHDALGLLDYPHIPLRCLKQHFEADFDRLGKYRSFALVREPHARFASSLSERFIHFQEKPLEALSKREISREIAEITEYLSDPALRLPITDPNFIHFSRQIDYLELDGHRLIDSIYSIARMDRLMHDIGRLIGREIEVPPRHNRRRIYSVGMLRNAETLTRRLADRAVPRGLREPIFAAVRTALLRAGLLKGWREAHRDLFESARVSDFISSFYEDDIRIFKEVSDREAPARAAGVR